MTNRHYNSTVVSQVKKQRGGGPFNQYSVETTWELEKSRHGVNGCLSFSHYRKMNNISTWKNMWKCDTFAETGIISVEGQFMRGFLFCWVSCFDLPHLWKYFEILEKIWAFHMIQITGTSNKQHDLVCFFAGQI